MSLPHRAYLFLGLGLLIVAALGAYIVGPLLRLPRGAPIKVEEGWDSQRQELSGAVAVSPAEVVSTKECDDRAEAARALFVKAEQSKREAREALFKQIIDQYPGTSWAPRAKLRLSELQGGDDRTREGQNVFEGVAEQVRILAEWGDYQAAERICANYLQGRPPAELAPKVAELRAEIEREAEREFKQVKNEIGALTAQRKFAAARRLIEASRKVFNDQGRRALLAEVLRAVDQAAEETDSNKERDKLRHTKLARLKAIFDLVGDSKPDEALHAVRTLSAAGTRLKLDEISELAAALEQSVRAEKHYAADLIERVNRAAAKNVMLRISASVQGRVLSATPEKIRLALAGGATTEAAWGSIPPEDFVSLARAYAKSTSGDDHFAVGAIATHRRQFAVADAEFKLALLHKAALAEPCRQLQQLSELFRTSGE